MAVYIWKGKNRYGDSVGGERVASSAEELTRYLQKEQITVSSIAPKRAVLRIPFLKREKVKIKELAVYSRQLSVLIDAELPLIQSLNILAEQTRNKYFKKVITTIREDVEAGASLNQAKRKFPKAFDDLYCNLIASGEQSGSLDTMLQRLSEYIEKIVKLRGQVRQAMIYPSAIVIFAICVVHLPDVEGHSHIRRHLQGTRGQTAFPDSVRHQLEPFRFQLYLVYIFLGIIGLVFALPLFPEDAAGPVDDRQAHFTDAAVRQALVQSRHIPHHADAQHPVVRRRIDAGEHEDHGLHGRAT